MSDILKTSRNVKKHTHPSPTPSTATPQKKMKKKERFINTMFEQIATASFWEAVFLGLSFLGILSCIAFSVWGLWNLKKPLNEEKTLIDETFYEVEKEKINATC